MKSKCAENLMKIRLDKIQKGQRKNRHATGHYDSHNGRNSPQKYKSLRIVRNQESEQKWSGKRGGPYCRRYECHNGAFNATD